MPKKYSLKYKKDFDKVFSANKRLHSRYFVCNFVPSDSFKIAIVVSKKICKKSVHRNYSKRIIREIVRSYIKLYGLLNCFVIIRPKFNLKTLKKEIGFLEIKNDLFKLFEKLKDSI